MKRPNVLIFMTDQQRGDTVLPGSAAKMPNIERFRKQGVAFSETFCPSPHCCPARATFFTGLYPAQHGVWHNVNVPNAITRVLAPGVRTWSEDYRDAGYRMRFSGKWHISNDETPADRGWDGPTGRPNTPGQNAWAWPNALTPRAEKPRGEGEIVSSGYNEFRLYGLSDEDPNGRDIVGHDLRVVNRAIANLRSLTAEDSADPWCMYVGCSGPHDPYFAPKRFLDLYDPDEIQLPPSYKDDLRDKPNFYRRTRGIFDRLPEREQREALRHYLAVCSFEDELFGRVLSALEASGQADNTLVIFCSDHGDYTAEHGLWCKGLPCFRGAYHVPMILRWPGRIANPGRTVGELVSLADIAPTLLEAAGIDGRRSMTGQSLAPFLRGEKPAAWRDAIFTQTNGNELYGIQRSVSTKDYKFVYNGFDYDELYDLKSDPHEMHNVVGDPKYNDLIREAMQRIWNFSQQTGDACTNPYITVRFSQHGPGIVSKKVTSDK